jgi:outer membrane scaffolding protein for murein synthesis (MipA/OmpV family)
MKLVVFTVCLALAASGAAAQGWSVTAGPGALIAPKWEGADGMTVGPLPWLSVGPIGEPPRFAAPDDSLGIGLFSGPVRVGLVGALRGERDAAGDRIGLRHVDSAFELGASVDFWPAEWLRTRIEIKKGLAGHKGWIADLGADAVATSGPFTFAAGPRLGVGDDTYMDTYFGVSSAEAIANPTILAPYDPDAGIRYAGAALGVIHRHGRWSEVAGIAWHRLTGDANDSPMVSQLGSSSQMIITLGIMYTFDVGN